MRVLWLTNDLPPKTGGIEQFVANLLDRVHPDETLVVGPPAEDPRAHDARREWDVRRAPATVLPTPPTLRLTRAAAADHRPDVIVLGASWPLGHLAGPLRREPGVPIVALSHGLEAGLCGVGLGPVVGLATRHLAAVTTISAYTERRLRRHVRARRVVRVPPGVDPSQFRPGRDGAGARRMLGLPGDATVVGCVSRLVRRKGQDALLRVWPGLAHRYPDAWLVLVGGGSLASRLRADAAGLPRVVIAGEVPWERLPDVYAALDVFAMPCRTRLLGLDVEGLGIVYLEAQAGGVPVVAGSSGGAPETVLDGESGMVVDGRDDEAIAGALDRLLGNGELRRRWGAAGREHVQRHWSWDVIAGRFASLLDEVVEEDGVR